MSSDEIIYERKVDEDGAKIMLDKTADKYDPKDFIRERCGNVKQGTRKLDIELNLSEGRQYLNWTLYDGGYTEEDRGTVRGILKSNNDDMDKTAAEYGAGSTLALRAVHHVINDNELYTTITTREETTPDGMVWKCTINSRLKYSEWKLVPMEGKIGYGTNASFSKWTTPLKNEVYDLFTKDSNNIVKTLIRYHLYGQIKDGLQVTVNGELVEYVPIIEESLFDKSFALRTICKKGLDTATGATMLHILNHHELTERFQTIPEYIKLAHVKQKKNRSLYKLQQHMEDFSPNKFKVDDDSPKFTVNLTNLCNLYKNNTSFERYEHDEMVGKNKLNLPHTNQMYNNIMSEYGGRDILGFHIAINGIHPMDKGIHTGLGRDAGGGGGWSAYDKLVLMLSYNTFKSEHKRAFTKTEIEKHKSVLNSDGKLIGTLFGEVFYNEFFSTGDKQKNPPLSKDEELKNSDLAREAAEQALIEAENKTRIQKQRVIEAENARIEAENARIKEVQAREEAENKTRIQKQRVIEAENARIEAENARIKEVQARKEAETEAVEFQQIAFDANKKAELARESEEKAQETLAINTLEINNAENKDTSGKGAVYCLSDPTRPGYIKIGTTKAFTTKEAKGKLETQYCLRYFPHGVKVKKIIISDGANNLEQSILKSEALKTYKIGKSEWFRFPNLSEEEIYEFVGGKMDIIHTCLQ